MKSTMQAEFWQGPFRVIQPNLRLTDADALDVEQLVREAKDWGANALLVNGGGISAWYPTQLQLQARNERLTFDYLGEIARAAHRAGMKVIARLDVSKTHAEVLERHPDWFRRTRSGDTIGRDRIETCVTGPYWSEEYNMKVIGELLDLYPVDGLFYNHWIYGTCHCSRCREDFLQATGRQLPVTEDWADPAWQLFIRYRYDKFSALTAKVKAFIHQKSPGTVFMIDTEMTNDDPHKMQRNGWYTSAMAEATDLISVEAFNFLDRPHPRWIYWAGEEVKIGKHFSNIAVILSYSAVLDLRRAAQPPGQAVYDLLQIAANGGSPAIAFSGSFDQHDTKAIPPLKKWMRFLAEHDSEYRGMQPYAQAAIVYSQRTADVYGGAQPNEAWQQHYRGIYEMMAESHIPFTVLHEGALKHADLSRYRCILLPNTAVLDEQEAEALDAYAAHGGTIIATFETGMYNTQGEPRESCMLNSIGRQFKARESLTHRYGVLKNRSRFEKLGYTEIVGLQGDLLITEAEEEDAASWSEELRLTGQLGNNTPEFAYWEHEDDRLSALLTRRYGKGVVHYLPWPVDKLYHVQGLQEYKLLIEQLVDEAIAERMVVTDAPGSVELTVGLRERDGLVIHLLNATGIPGKPLQEAIPVYQLRVGLKGKFQRVRTLVGDAKPELRQEGDYTYVTIPKLVEAEVLIAER